MAIWLSYGDGSFFMSEVALYTHFVVPEIRGQRDQDRS